jgi:hypothetical protein
MPLTLFDYSDRELLIKVHEVAEENGGSTNSRVLAEGLGLTEKERAQSVGSRMMWLRRFGVVEKAIDREPAEWRLTALGETLAFGSARKAQLMAIDRANDNELLLMMREMGQRQFDAPEGARHLIRREWTRSSRRNGR